MLPNFYKLPLNFQGLDTFPVLITKVIFHLFPDPPMLLFQTLLYSRPHVEYIPLGFCSCMLSIHVCGLLVLHTMLLILLCLSMHTSEIFHLPHKNLISLLPSSLPFLLAGHCPNFYIHTAKLD